MTMHQDIAPQELNALARRAFATLAQRDLDRPELIWRRTPSTTWPVGDAIRRDVIVAFFREMFDALPDFSVEVERTVAAPPYVVVQWRITGTFTGARFQGVRVTGRRVDFRGCDVVEIEDGLVKDNTVYWDGAGFARQVGLPAQGSLGDRLLLRAFNTLTWVRTLGGRRVRKAG